MSTNSLVAETQNPSNLSGTFLGADIYATCQAVGNGSWVAIGLAGVADAVDLAATVSDPFGSLIAAGVGWAIDHINPLKKWMEELTGSPQEVEAYSKTWENIGQRLEQEAEEMKSRVASELSTATGTAIDAYREHGNAMSESMQAIAASAEGVGKGFEGASRIIDFVHGFVRDVIAQICGAVASWFAELVFSFGLLTPLVIEQVTTRVSAGVEKVTSKVTGVVESSHSLEELVKALSKKIGDLREELNKIHPGAARGKHEGSFDDPATPRPHGADEGPKTARDPDGEPTETPKNENTHTRDEDAPTKHRAEQGGLGERAKELAVDKAKEMPRSIYEDGVTETATYDNGQARELHTEIQKTMPPGVYSPI